MIDLFGLEHRRKEYEKTRKELREATFETVKNSNEFLFKILGKENSKESFDWRLEFDKKRYNINF